MLPNLYYIHTYVNLFRFLSFYRFLWIRKREQMFKVQVGFTFSLLHIYCNIELFSLYAAAICLLSSCDQLMLETFLKKNVSPMWRK